MAEEDDFDSSLNSSLPMPFIGIGKDGEELESSLDAPLSMSFMDANQDLLEQQTNNAQSSVDMSLSSSSDGRTLLQSGGMFYHYSLEKKLGSGGMGEVFLAINIRNNQKVAIKTLKVKSGSTSERFRREYEFLRRVDHPNLIKAYDFKESDKELFLVMEFVGGQSLKELIEQGHNFSFGDKIAIASQIAGGIHALNLAGIIHRDIKPANIMVNSAAGIVKILDLGLSKDTEGKFDAELTQAKQILGTCFYMAPEQTEGQVTPTTDIFALGTVMWEWFSGSTESPFFADNQYRAFMRIMTHEPVKLIAFFPKNDGLKIVYQHLSNIVAKAMEKEPDKRFPNAGAVAEELLKLHKHMRETIPQISQHNWRETSLTPNMHQSLVQASSVFRDKDVSLSGQINVSAIMKKPTKQTNLSQSGLYNYKAPRLARKTGVIQQQRYESGAHVCRKSTGITRETLRTQKKATTLRNVLILVIILLVASAVVLFWQISENQEQERMRTKQMQKAFGKAENLFTEGEYDLAEEQYKDIVRKFTSTEAKAKIKLIQKIQESLQQYKEATNSNNHKESEVLYNNILQLNPDSQKTRQKLDEIKFLWEQEQKQKQERNLFDKEQQKQQEEVIKWYILVQAEQGEFGKILQKYWLKEEMCFDFSHNDWGKLYVEKQIQYAADYQKWYIKAKNTTIEKLITVNNATFEMMLIPPGKFWMGSAIVTEVGHQSDETRHKVLISKPFWLAKTEVTQKQWQAITEKNPSFFKENGEDKPVEQVSWSNSQDFCRKMQSLYPKLKWRLPTEAQWEYACRGGTTSAFYWSKDWDKSKINSLSYWGDGDIQGSAFGEYIEYMKAIAKKKKVDISELNLKNTGQEKTIFLWNKLAIQKAMGTVEVKKFPKNSFGLYDMLGNVWEWCEDSYDENYYINSSEKDPVCKNSHNSLVVDRGGSWHNGFLYCRSAKRGGNQPTATSSTVGFRLSSLFE